MTRRIFLLILVVTKSFLLHAQIPSETKGSGKITGIIIDTENNIPVEFATIALHNVANKIVDGTVADAKGKFSITKISEGTYSVVVSFIGYETQTISGITISTKENDINMGTIKLSTSSKVLNEVVVEGKKDLIEERVDRTVYNAENDKTTAGGDATDVLKRVPMLSVDLDGNVSMRGSNNVLVLINNKPSTIVANSVADALKQIPADQIKSVEVITSPSAKYDAEGSAGIINIITKKNSIEGLTLNIDAGVGYRGANLGLNGNYRKKKMGFSLGGFGRANYNINGNFENQQTTIDEQDEFKTIQKAGNRNNGLFGNYTLGWDYDINPKNLLAASVRYGARNGNNYQDELTTTNFLNNIETGSSLRDVKTTDLSGTVDVNLTYTHLFDQPQREFSFLTLYSRNDRVNDFTNIIFNPDATVDERIKNENDGLNEELTIQADYVLPIGAKQLFEVGAKEIRRRVTSDYTLYRADGESNAYVPDLNASKTNQLNYNQDVTSGYLSYTYNTQKTYSFKTGLRYEYTTIDAFTRTESNIDIPSYGVLVPSVNVSKKLKNSNTLKASYNRRIQRPSIQFLNPNIQNANPFNQTIGNPQLDPEFTNNYELGYSTYIKNSSISLTGFYRNTNNSIQSIRTVSGDTIVTRYANIGREDAYGMSIFANITTGKLMLNGGGDVYYAILDNNVEDVTQRSYNEGFVPSARLFGSYTLEKGWAIQVFGFYRGRRVQLQGFQGGFGFYSAGIRKEFANKKGSIGLSFENFFAKSVTIRNETNTPTINQAGFTTLNNLSFRINISYRIGKMNFDNQPRRRRSINNDDLKDGGDGGQGDGQSGGQRGGGGFTGTQRQAQGNTVTKPSETLPTNPSAVVQADGVWNYTVESPQGGTGTLTIIKEGEAYKGTMMSNRLQKEVPINSIVVKGDEITFTYDVSFGGYTTTIQVKGIISGDALEGNMSVGQFGTFPIKAIRIK